MVTAVLPSNGIMNTSINLRVESDKTINVAPHVLDLITLMRLGRLQQYKMSKHGAVGRSRPVKWISVPTNESGIFSTES